MKSSFLYPNTFQQLVTFYDKCVCCPEMSPNNPGSPAVHVNNPLAGLHSAHNTNLVLC